VARDRKRAKQRRDRGAALARRSARGDAAANGAASNGAASPQGDDGATPPRAHGTIERADLPGALEHAGAEVDEFDAALVRGAGGTPLAPGEQAELEGEGAPEG
jgi:hypothetical protein